MLAIFVAVAWIASGETIRVQFGEAIKLRDTHDFRVKHVPAGLGRGHFYIEEQREWPDAVYRVKMAGPTIEILDVTKKHAYYQACKPGIYFVEVAMLFDSFKLPEEYDLQINKTAHAC